MVRFTSRFIIPLVQGENNPLLHLGFWPIVLWRYIIHPIVEQTKRCSNCWRHTFEHIIHVSRPHYIMFHAPMGRFQLELIYYFTYFSPTSHQKLVCFFPVDPSLLIHFQQVLWELKFLLSPGLVFKTYYYNNQ